MTSVFYNANAARMRAGLYHIAVLSATISCSTVGPQEHPVLDITPFITPSVAAKLDDKGFLVLPQQGQQPSEISAEEAKLLAQDWVRLYAPYLREGLQREHGARISLAELKPCGTVMYASSPFQPLPPEIPAVYRRAFGSWWIVLLCRAGVAQVYLAVNAAAGHLFDAHAGRQPEGGSVVAWGNEYGSVGIPGGRTAELLLTPESVVSMVATWSGRRVSSVPELVVGMEGPFVVRWKVNLEGSLQARRAGSGRSVETSEFYVGPVFDSSRWGRVINRDPKTIAVAADVQPEGREFLYLTDAQRSLGPSADRTIGFARRRADRALALDQVVRQ